MLLSCEAGACSTRMHMGQEQPSHVYTHGSLQGQAFLNERRRKEYEGGQAQLEVNRLEDMRVGEFGSSYGEVMRRQSILQETDRK